MKVYTSFWGNKLLAKHPEVVKVRISIGVPRWPVGYKWEQLTELAPWGLKDEHHRPTFVEKYNVRLEKVGVAALRAKMQEISEANGGADLVLLCFEGLSPAKLEEGQWCHRKVFAEWWAAQTGEELEEYPAEYPAEKPKASAGGGKRVKAATAAPPAAAQGVLFT